MAMPSCLCQSFAKVLGGEATVMNGVCTVSLERKIPATILGRKTDSALALYAFFSFESLDSNCRSLNLGETVIRQSEANPLISALRAQGITVTALHNHWLFDVPRLMFIHFESIDNPITFAQKVVKAFKVLGPLTSAESEPPATGTCLTFARILGGTGTFQDTVCRVMKIRNISATILGRKTRSPLVLAQMFSFENRDSQGRTLNLGETPILQGEINPFISELRKRGLIVTSIHNHWLFDSPRIMFVHFESVEPPLVFAQKVAAASKVLKS